MPRNHRNPAPGEFGTELVSVSTQAGTSPLTVNGTTIFRLGGFGRRVRFANLVVSCTTVAADADGTILATAYKYDASADAQVALTSSTDLETLTTREAREVVPLATQTDAQLTIDADDTIEVSVVNNSAAINTQPTDLIFRVFGFALE